MEVLSCGSYEAFYEQLREEVARRLGLERGARVAEFARRYYEQFPLEELEGRPLSDVYGCTLGWWHFIQRFEPSRAKIDVFNPSVDADGWIAAGTVVTILTRAMPFLVDSIRIALNRSKVTIRTVHGCVLETCRDHEHELVGLGPTVFVEEDERESDETTGGPRDCDAQFGATRREALIYLEIDRHSSQADHQAIADEIAEVLRDVELAVGDFQAMRDRVRALIGELEKSQAISIPDAELSEATDFLSWMLDDHFTFLGFAEVEFVVHGGAMAVREIADSRLGLHKKRERGSQIGYLHEMNPLLVSTLAEPRLLEFSKSSVRSTVHRSAHSDYVTIKRFDEHGDVVGELRFMGLYTSCVYTQSPFDIPVVRTKLRYAMEHAGAEQAIFQGRYLEHVLEGFPRDELFQSTAPELYRTALGVMRMQERKRVRLFVRRGAYGRFVSCLVYIPRDLYTTDLRRRVEEVLAEVFGASELEFTTTFCESVLARTHFVLKVDPDLPVEYDLDRIEARLVEIAKTWQQKLAEVLSEAFGEEKGAAVAREYEDAFPAAYMDDFEPRVAIADLQAISCLDSKSDIAMHFFRSIEEPENRIRFKLFHLDEEVALSDLIPILENLGLRVAGEHPYAIRRQGGRTIWIHDFRLDYVFADAIDLAQVKENFRDAFAAIWHGKAENDGFNRLVLGTRLQWRQVAVLRAYARYMKQITFHFSLQYIAETLARHLAIAQDIVALFEAHFDPDLNHEPAVAERAQRDVESRILAALEAVDSLDEDRIVRHYIGLIRATLRTNFYQLDAEGEPKPYFSFKLDPHAIADVPPPRPMYEIFVYSPRVEGVHLRAGRVARGGLRWSDRLEDFRTEILGLLKAQQVKNAVIVPVGAKGGFVARRARVNGSREELHAEGVACYQTFVRGLLDLTDNLLLGVVVHPPRVVCKDGDDPYLVVAADKGTATFSDIANEISSEYEFWLGDAFASGGSVGYDHKKMGITARGAWVSVQRHFRECGIEIEKQDFTVVGIGDMSGDVFGNGMLLSKRARLVAAFNHLHILVDPNPNSQESFRERRRLFELPRSGWDDYDRGLISAGGGVFSRLAKSVDISPEMRERFDIRDERLTPNELISAILKARVDLIWNGGIGTWIKARDESHADVGDKANDAVRVDAEDLRCRVIGEGGNLGVTQRGRVAFCLQGGAANTDFIDNVGGVDCSDHEVNIKILLNEVMADQDITEKQRRLLLEEMTGDVAELVLANNYRQAQAISFTEAEVGRRMGEYRRYIRALESAGRLDRQLEFIPDDETLLERMAQGRALTRPELSILVSYTKAILKEEIAASRVPDDERMSRAVETAFPRKLRELYRDRIDRHRLRREIVATQIANDIVNRMGFTFTHRLQESTGAAIADVAQAYYTAREVFGLEHVWEQIDALNGRVSVETQMWLMSELMWLVRRGARWFLRNRRGHFETCEEIERFAPAVQEISRLLSATLQGRPREEWAERQRRVLAAGGCEELASFVAGAPNLYVCFALAEAAESTRASLERVIEVYFRLGEILDLHWVAKRIVDLRIDNHWQALARESALDDLDWQQRALTVSVLRLAHQGEPVVSAIERWRAKHESSAQRWSAMLNDLRGDESPDFAMCSVALRELLDWAQSSGDGEVAQG